MSDALARLASAATRDELHDAIGAISADASALDHLKHLAADLSENDLSNAAAFVWRLIAETARRQGVMDDEAESLLGELDAVEGYIDRAAAKIEDGARRAAAARARLGRRVAELRMWSAARLYLAIIGAFERSIAVAEAMLDSCATGDDLGGRIHGEVLLFSRKVFEATAGHGGGEELPRFFARAVLHLDRAGEEQLADCARAQMACSLVAREETERALGILEILETTIDRLAELRASSEEEVAQLSLADTRSVPEAYSVGYWMARALESVGRTTEAEERYRHHIALAEQTEIRRADAALRLALMLVEQQRFQRALDVLTTSHARLQKVPEHAALAAAIRARIEAALHRKTEADRFAKEAEAQLAPQPPITDPLEIDRDRDAPNDRPLRDIILYARLQLAAVREAAAEEIDTLESEAGEIAPSLVAAVRGVRADALVREGRLDEAEAALRSAIELRTAPRPTSAWTAEWPEPVDPDEMMMPMWRASRLHRGVALDLRLCLVRLVRQRGVDAAELLEEVIATAERENRPHILFDALLERGTGGDLERAADVLEALRADLRDAEMQFGVISGREVVYTRLLDRAVEARDAEAALRVMERGKSRTLLEQRRVEEPGDDSRASVLRTRIAAAMRRTLAEGAVAADQVQLAEWKTALAADLRRRLLPRRAGSRAAGTPEVARALTDETTALLHLFSDARGTYVVFAANGEAREPLFLAQAAAEEVETYLASFRFEIATGSEARSLEVLYALLLAPIERWLDGIERLLIIPHGLLHAVPFHALRGPDGAYLVERLTVCYAPSAAVAARCASYLDEHRRHLPSVLFAVHETPYLPLPVLPEFDDELTRLIPSLDVRTQDAATRKALFELEGDLELLQFDCHGEYDDDDPLLSRLYLATGAVYGYELFRLACRPRVVVLSACESGAQFRRAGDELYGLARGFLVNDAAAVIASSWRLPDAAARIMGRTFHEERLRTPSDPAGALRRAQLALLHTSGMEHPYYWGCWTIAGGFPRRRT